MKQRGSLMILALMLMTVMAVFVSVFLFAVNASTKIVSNQFHDSQAFYLAEAGMNKASSYLLADGSWWTAPYPAAAGSGANDPQNEALGCGSYTMWVEHLQDGSISIVASGTCYGFTRTLRTRITSQC